MSKTKTTLEPKTLTEQIRHLLDNALPGLVADLREAVVVYDKEDFTLEEISSGLKGVYTMRDGTDIQLSVIVSKPDPEDESQLEGDELDAWLAKVKA